MAASGRIAWGHAVGKAQLTTTEKAVAWAIGQHFNAACEANPSQARIASYAGCSPATVKRCLANIVGAGLLRVEYVHGSSNRYFGTVPTQVTAMSQGVGHSYELPTQVKQRGHSRKSGVTAMSYEIQEKQVADGVLAEPTAMAERWYNATGKEKDPTEARAFITNQWGLSDAEADAIVAVAA